MLLTALLQSQGCPTCYVTNWLMQKECCLGIRCWDIWAYISGEDVQSRYTDLHYCIMCIMATWLDFKTWFYIKKTALKSIILSEESLSCYSAIFITNYLTKTKIIYITVSDIRYICLRSCTWLKIYFFSKKKQNLDLIIWIINIPLWILNDCTIQQKTFSILLKKWL